MPESSNEIQSATASMNNEDQNTQKEAHIPGSCHSTSCPGNVNSVCPSELAVKGPDGSVIACKSACLALNQPQYCCTGAFGTPATCPPTNYSMIFKKQCPQAYSYAYDDKTSTFTCPTGANYLITFCP
ncbi:thaumatin-like protein 1 [Quercus suber]|uniref:Thaumatin-like protein 1 n=1 Tax=Quercus suber TaxID=58331 RepID=A0AAW0KSK0_QUESU